MNFIESKATWYDKSHNAYLDLLVEEGVFGAILFSAVVAFVIKTLWQMEDRRLALCLACGFIAYAISNAVAFDSFGSLFGAFLYLAGLSCVKFRKNQGKQPMRESEHVFSGGPWKSLGRRLGWFAKSGLIGTGLVLCLALYGNLGIGMSNAGFLEAQRNFAQDPALGIRLYERAFAGFSPYAAKEKLNCAYLIVNGLITKRSLPDASANTESALRLAREAISCHPQDAAFHMILNDLYNGLALYADKKYLTDAEASGIKALHLSPKRQEAIFYLGRTYVIKGEARRAVELNRSMVEEFPGFPLAHWFLGLSLLADTQNDLAKVEITKAIGLGYKFQNSSEADTVRQLFGETGFNELTSGK
jgi:tetratricopeptide (TPR) repeat protein